MIGAATSVEQGERSLTFTREFAAPRDLVFAAFTRPELLMRWWGPAQWPVVRCSLELRPGGVWHYCLRHADGREHWARAVYREIVPGHRLVYVDRTSNEAGDVTDELPQALTTVTFRDIPLGTEMVSSVLYPHPAGRDLAIGRGMAKGFTEALDQLDALLSTEGSTWTS